ncbi:hypothetical protein BpHYR1_017941 [Brachionus plicatilis]|uniref:Uncharacterized protein n=1 Tax=Brachionus plicatilis TaxID=10195 RepID=A0A3M7PZZ2_BRAPC|nr:hypothetical protein BpHYR1_017941 [Brachionus plicatilis]
MSNISSSNKSSSCGDLSELEPVVESELDDDWSALSDCTALDLCLLGLPVFSLGFLAALSHPFEQSVGKDRFKSLEFVFSNDSHKSSNCLTLSSLFN